MEFYVVVPEIMTISLFHRVDKFQIMKRIVEKLIEIYSMYFQSFEWKHCSTLKWSVSSSVALFLNNPPVWCNNRLIIIIYCFVINQIKEAIARRGDIQIDVMAVLNDTTGTLMACAWKNPSCRIGLIIGNWTFIHYFLDRKNHSAFWKLAKNLRDPSLEDFEILWGFWNFREHGRESPEFQHSWEILCGIISEILSEILPRTKKVFWRKNHFFVQYLPGIWPRFFKDSSKKSLDILSRFFLELLS